MPLCLYDFMLYAFMLFLCFVCASQLLNQPAESDPKTSFVMVSKVYESPLMTTDKASLPPAVNGITLFLLFWSLLGHVLLCDHPIRDLILQFTMHSFSLTSY